MAIDPAAERAADGPPPGLVRDLVRPQEGRMVAGVCAGVGRAVGVDPLVVRLAVVVLTVANGIGLVAYLAAWVLMPDAGSALRQRAAPGTVLPERAIAVGLITFGALLGSRELGLLLPDSVVWPVTLAAVGMALVWTRSSPAERDRWRALVVAGDPLAAVRSGRAMVARAAAGLLLLIVGLAVLLRTGSGAFADLGRIGIAVLATALGVLLLLGPWILRLWRDLVAERRQRIRSDERAEVAAHLHDSVLQTLALIQRHADAPAQARSLARRQERELRAWLYGERAPSAATLQAALDAAAGEVEAAHDVTVEVVVVGDCPLDGPVEALALAVREATVNAARHAGVGEVSVYVEVEDDRVTAFVRDRGNGFDPEAVEPGRLGIARSIVDRAERHGGRAEVSSSPGEGTEVIVEVPRATRNAR